MELTPGTRLDSPLVLHYSRTCTAIITPPTRLICLHGARGQLANNPISSNSFLFRIWLTMQRLFFSEWIVDTGPQLPPYTYKFELIIIVLPK